MMTQNAAIEILRASRLNTVGGEKVLLHLPIWPLQDDVSNKISTVARGDHHVIPGFSNWQQQHAIHSREHLLPFYPLLCPARLFFVFFFFFFPLLNFIFILNSLVYPFIIIDYVHSLVISSSPCGLQFPLLSSSPRRLSGSMSSRPASTLTRCLLRRGVGSI